MTGSKLLDHGINPSNLSDERGYQLQIHRLRPMLGLNAGKLPDNQEQLHFTLGNVSLTLLTKEQAARLQPGVKKPVYRLYATCPRCGRFVPAGKFHQHRRGEGL